VHCKYREVFVLPMVERRKDPSDRLFPRVLPPLFARLAFSFNERGKRVCTQSSSSSASSASSSANTPPSGGTNNESGVYIGFPASCTRGLQETPQFASGSPPSLQGPRQDPCANMRSVFFEIPRISSIIGHLFLRFLRFTRQRRT